VAAGLAAIALLVGAGPARAVTVYWTAWDISDRLYYDDKAAATVWCKGVGDYIWTLDKYGDEWWGFAKFRCHLIPNLVRLVTITSHHTYRIGRSVDPSTPALLGQDRSK
jgi:hypothetical protein